MPQLLKQIIKRTPLYDPLCSWKARRQIREWERNGRPAPPPHPVKQQTLLEYADQYQTRILVETGTYYGDMVDAMKSHFDCVYSIELSQELFEKAMQRFRGVSNVVLVQGDSGEKLDELVQQIDSPALFWLDGHYSAGVTARGEKDTPIFEELDHIFNGSELAHVIIIDDARCFGTDPAYPTIDELKAYILSKRPMAGIEVDTDSIRVTPAG